jgi:hypothetical protein
LPRAEVMSLRALPVSLVLTIWGQSGSFILASI